MGWGSWSLAPATTTAATATAGASGGPLPTAAAGPKGADPSTVAAGRLPIAEAGVEGTILRLVLATDGDPDDQAAVDAWVARYRDGEPLTGIAEAFATAKAFVKRYADLDDPAFLDGIHRNLLGRAPTADEVTWWSARLAQGGRRAEVLLALSESSEYVAITHTAVPVAPRPLLAPAGIEHSVSRLYLGLTGAWPDRATFDDAVRRYLDGTPLATIADGALATPAVPRLVRESTGEAFVTALFGNLRVEEPDPAAVDAWAARLAAGESPGTVAAAFTESPEVVARTRTTAPLPAPLPRRLLAVGDSVLMGAADEVAATPGWTTTVDALGCRQPTWRGDGCQAVDIPSGLDALRSARANGLLGGVVVIHLGNNGPMSAAQFDQLMAEVADQRLVLALTLHEPRSFEAGNNAVITGAVQRWPNLRVVDWHACRPGSPRVVRRRRGHPRQPHRRSGSGRPHCRTPAPSLRDRPAAPCSSAGAGSVRAMSPTMLAAAGPRGDGVGHRRHGSPCVPGDVTHRPRWFRPCP